mmetsp:Transcript_49284/g.157829  ORF Transcript_49284/g.157829 Transcript_49284/m.157829 type:complete len:242 (+) Transcript_49284:265-990(+)
MHLPPPPPRDRPPQGGPPSHPCGEVAARGRRRLGGPIRAVPRGRRGLHGPRGRRGGNGGGGGRANRAGGGRGRRPRVPRLRGGPPLAAARRGRGGGREGGRGRGRRRRGDGHRGGGQGGGLLASASRPRRGAPRDPPAALHPLACGCARAARGVGRGAARPQPKALPGSAASPSLRAPVPYEAPRPGGRRHPRRAQGAGRAGAGAGGGCWAAGGRGARRVGGRRAQHAGNVLWRRRRRRVG